MKRIVAQRTEPTLFASESGSQESAADSSYLCKCIKCMRITECVEKREPDFTERSEKALAAPKYLF
jgi:hypothetical protein